MNIGIYGYGNLARGVEYAASVSPDMKIVGAFTRRDPDDVHTVTGVPVYKADSIIDFKEKIDVLIICGGSATDLPVMTPELAKNFNVVDSFDNHNNIPSHFEKVDNAAKQSGKTALISCGWDPGMFSLARLYAECILPGGKTNTFWGRGVSQGHSDAIRRIEGVIDARQYTVPVTETVNAVRGGDKTDFTPRQKHLRECYVVVSENADKEKIEQQIKSMPDYFEPYDTTVTFISKEEMQKNHSELPHGGNVITTGKTGNGHLQAVEYTLKLGSNPEFTGSVLVAFARAVYKLNGKGETGAKTVFDVPPALLSTKTPEELRHGTL